MALTADFPPPAGPVASGRPSCLRWKASQSAFFRAYSAALIGATLVALAVAGGGVALRPGSCGRAGGPPSSPPSPPPFLPTGDTSSSPPHASKARREPTSIKQPARRTKRFQRWRSVTNVVPPEGA